MNKVDHCNNMAVSYRSYRLSRRPRHHSPPGPHTLSWRGAGRSQGAKPKGYADSRTTVYNLIGVVNVVAAVGRESPQSWKQPRRHFACSDTLAVLGARLAAGRTEEFGSLEASSNRAPSRKSRCATSPTLGRRTRAADHGTGQRRIVQRLVCCLRTHCPPFPCALDCRPLGTG